MNRPFSSNSERETPFMKAKYFYSTVHYIYFFCLTFHFKKNDTMERLDQVHLHP